MNRKKTFRVLKEAKRLKKNFSEKIKSVKEIKELIGKRPRKRTVVMCHGTFDIVHPGHIRQLIYAKTKGDILVASLTADKNIIKGLKGEFRPYVPQELRALNLSAFEIVDFVIIDSNSTPIENIKILQPDYFVKGFEYSLNGIHPKTRDEINILESYGGEMVFSPGDVIYSSSELLRAKRPNLALEQLKTLMDAENISFKMLKNTVKKFSEQKIHVVGDTIIDKYSICHILGPSKDLAFSVRLDSTNSYVGGAGIVAKHLSSLGAQVTFTTVLGKDDSAKYALDDLRKANVKVNAVFDSSRPTTEKHRYVTDDKRMLLQVDKVDNSIISENIVEQLCKSIKKTKTSAIIFTDFRHGIFNSQTIRKFQKNINKNSIKVADSQVSNRWGNILDFEGFDLITPNEKEARFALADQDTTIRPLAQKLYNFAKCKYLILKLGENGIMTYRSPGMELREYFYNDSLAQEVADPVGAGDALLAASTLTLAACNDIVQASIIGNIAAAFECSQIGNVPFSKKDLLGTIENLEKNIT